MYTFLEHIWSSPCLSPFIAYHANDVNASNYLLRARSTNSESRLTLCSPVLPANNAFDGIARSPFQIADFVSTLILALAFVDEVGSVIEMGGLIVVVSGGAEGIQYISSVTSVHSPWLETLGQHDITVCCPSTPPSFQPTDVAHESPVFRGSEGV